MNNKREEGLFRVISNVWSNTVNSELIMSIWAVYNFRLHHPWFQWLKNVG